MPAITIGFVSGTNMQATSDLDASAFAARVEKEGVYAVTISHVNGRAVSGKPKVAVTRAGLAYVIDRKP